MLLMFLRASTLKNARKFPRRKAIGNREGAELCLAPPPFCLVHCFRFSPRSNPETSTETRSPHAEVKWKGECEAEHEASVMYSTSEPFSRGIGVKSADPGSLP